MSNSNTIAIIGAGHAGFSILTILLQIPGIQVKYVCDVNPDAPGIKLAVQNNIKVINDLKADEVLKDPVIEMIMELTGDDDIFNYLQENKLPSCNIMCASMARIIFFLLESQQKVTKELREYKLKLAERVIERTDELEKVNIQLKEQVNIEQSLNDKLQEINNEKTKYLLNATHQLKAPFAAIQSYVDILLEGYADVLSEKSQNVVRKIQARCILLSSSIKHMLELANLNSMVEENIVFKNENLSLIVENVIKSEAGILEKRNIFINFTHKEIFTPISCNADQIETLIQILIDNAVNYSHDNSKIDVTIDLDSRNRIVLSITDYGIGIEAKNLKLIFNEYFRGYNAAKQYDNGTGLGLAIAQKIARIHHGDIFVDSRLEMGSTFMIPFKKAEE